MKSIDWAILQQAKTVILPGVEIKALGVFPDSRNVIISTGDGTVSLLKKDGTLIELTHESEDEDGYLLTLQTLVGLPNQKVIGANFNSCRYYSLQDSTLKEEFTWDLLSQKSTSSSISIAASSDGKLLAASANDYLHILQPDGSSRYVHDENKDFWGTAFSPAGDYLANGRADGTIELRNPKTLEIEKSFIGLTECILCLAFSPDGKYLAAADDRAGLMVWDLVSGKAQEISNWSKIIGIHWFSDSSGLCAVSLSRQISLINHQDYDEDSAFSLMLQEYSPNYIQSSILQDDSSLIIFVEQTGGVFVRLGK